MGTNRFLEFIQHLRMKPEHIRRQIALGTSVGVTGVVAAGWLVALLASGSLTLQSSTVASSAKDSSEGVSSAFAETKSSFSQLLGAAGIAGGSDAPAALVTVDSFASSTLDTHVPQEPTIIRF